MKVSLRHIALDVFAFLAFALLTGAGLLAWRLSQGPIDLEFIRPQVERSLSEARGGQAVKIEKLGLEWVRDRGRVEAVARNFTAMDSGNQVAFRAKRAMISLDAGSLLAFQVHARQLRLEDGTASVVRSKDGVWTMADMVLAREPDQSERPFDPIRDINWTTLATPIRALISAGSFEKVELANFHLDVDDQKSGTTWSADPVSGSWGANSEGVELNLDIRLAGAMEGEPNRIAIALVSDGEVKRASGRLTLQGVNPMLIARMFGYTGDAFTSGKPANAVFSVSATERSGLQSTALSLSGVTGSGKIGDTAINVNDLSFEAGYDPATKQVTLKSLSIDSDKVAGAFTGTLDARAIMSGEHASATPFTLQGHDFTLNLTPFFEAPWDIKTAAVEGSISPDLSRVMISRLDAAMPQLSASGAGEVWFVGEGETFDVGVKGQATAQGSFTTKHVLAFWPVTLSPEARTWVGERITAGTGRKAVFNVDWPPGAVVNDILPDEHLSLDFEVENASVRFLKDFPAATAVTGVGHLRGNSMTFDITTGLLGTWQVDEGKVVLPRFKPEGAMMQVTAVGRGPLGELLQVVEDSDLDLGARYEMPVDQITGTGSLSVKLEAPMVADPPKESIRFNIDGGFQSVAAPDIISGFGLTDGNVNVVLTHDGMSLTGRGQFGPAPITFEWTESVGKGDSNAELVAAVRATPDLLNAFGFAARNLMQGEAALELRASGPGGRNFNSVTATVDLTHAQLDLSEFGWRKKYDAPARGTFRYGKDNDGGVLTGDIRADGLELIGEARLGANSSVKSIDIERIFSRDNVDLRGSVTARQDGGYRVALNGPFFDASPWMDQLLDMSGGAVTAPDQAVGGPADAGPMLDLQLNVDRLRIRPDAEIGKARIAVAIDADGPKSGTITGQISAGKAVSVTLGTSGDYRTIAFRADDAAFAARVLLKADYIVGGKLAIDGKFKGADGEALVTMTDVRLKDAPFLATLFSLASLQGLADVLNGEGVMFTEVHAPVRLVGGRIDLPGMRATGPAMGITARGWIAPESGELALDGVLAPSLIGVNAVLGGLPIIGDLFVSRQGEGMFAPTYSVRGTFASARISLNPVAALTPGVLRRIFENPAEPPPVSELKPTTPPAAQD